MDIPAALAFIRDNHRAVLATRRRDGEPQMSPVLAVVDDAGRILISTRETAVKTRNLRRNPRAWLCVMNKKFFGKWLQVDADVEIVSLPEAMEMLVDYYRRAVGEHPDWDEYCEAMEREQRCVLVLTPTRAGPNVSG